MRWSVRWRKSCAIISSGKRRFDSGDAGSIPRCPDSGLRPVEVCKETVDDREYRGPAERWVCVPFGFSNRLDQRAEAGVVDPAAPHEITGILEILAEAANDLGQQLCVRVV